MTDSEIWNKGKKSVIDSIPVENESLDMFSLKAIKIKPYINTTLNIGCHKSSSTPVFTYQAVYNEGYEYFIGNMVLNFNSPSVSGLGQACYCDHFGYAAIERISVKIGDAEFLFSGDYIFNKVISNCANVEEVLSAAGHNSLTRKIFESEDKYEEIIPQTPITVLVPLPFGENVPKNLFPLAVNDKIRVEVIYKHMSSLVNHRIDSNLQYGDYTDHNLTLQIYCRKNEPRVLYEPRIDIPFTIYTNETTKTLPLSRHFTISQRIPPTVYPFMIDNYKSESDVVQMFVNQLIDNLLYVVNINNRTEFLKQFPPKAKLIEVINNQAVIRTNVVDSSTDKAAQEKTAQKRVIHIAISGVPSDHVVYYHSNLLVINKYESNKELSSWLEDFNISEKVYNVIGVYNQSIHKVIPIRVEHAVVSQYASIPLEVFDVYGEDNRKINVKNYKIFTHFSNGPNIFNPLHYIYLIMYNESESQQNILVDHSIKNILQSMTQRSNHQTSISLCVPQNESRFSFKNWPSSSCVLKIIEKPFSVKKYELIKDFKPNKIFNIPRHREENFISLFKNVSYVITYFDSIQITQKVSPSGDKVSAEMKA